MPGIRRKNAHAASPAHGHGTIRAMVKSVHSARVGSVLWLISLCMGCDGLWSPFLMERGICEVGAVSCAETDVRPKLVLVRKGSFTMGSPMTEAGRGGDEVQHPVTLTTDFWMAESEVTQRQYRNLMGSSPSSIPGDDLPVESISWYEAVEYCNALSVKEKLTPCYQIGGMTVGWADGMKCTGYRLPTEAEWEYAANPATPPRTVYAGSDTVDEVAWIQTNAGSSTHAVKTKTANGRRVYDLSGNVSEWVWDIYQSNYEALPSTDPMGPSTGTQRVLRGGAFGGFVAYARVAQRGSSKPTIPFAILGFRIVRSNP